MKGKSRSYKDGGSSKAQHAKSVQSAKQCQSLMSRYCVLCVVAGSEGSAQAGNHLAEGAGTN
jgi:hypothetical protein